MPCPCTTSSPVYISSEPLLKYKRQVVVCPRKVVVSTNPVRVISTVPVATCRRAAAVVVEQAKPAAVVVEPAQPVAAAAVVAERVEAVAAVGTESAVIVENGPVTTQTIRYELGCPCKPPTTYVKNVETTLNRHHYHTIRVVDNVNNYDTYVTNHITKVNDIHHQRVEHVKGETRVFTENKETRTVEPAKCVKVVDGKTVDC